MFTDLTQDLRFAARTLRRDATFTTFAVVIVALGIAASATVFSVANALLLRPLPFRDPGRLVWIPNGGDAGLSAQTTQVNHLLDLTAETHSFTDIAAYFAFYGAGDAQVTGTSDAVRLSMVPVTQNFFPLLGVVPALGRSFTADEASEHGAKAVMLSHSLWERRFASDPGIIGKPITINDSSVTVVGVLPATFDFGSVFAPGTRIDLFTPFPLSERTNRWGNTVAIVGRLKPGVSISSATADVNVVAAGITAAHPERNRFHPKLISLRDHVSGKIQSALTILTFSVAVVMLIVCANLSNLLLARATIRQKEMAIRAALGAGRQRLIRQMLTESVVLSSCGAVLGLVLAVLATRAIAHMSAVSLPLIETVHVDAVAFGFTLLLSLMAGLAFGLVPALQIPESATHDALRASTRGSTDGRRGQWTRRSLVVSEIALACMLVVGSGLLIRSFLKVMDVDLGFRPESVAALRVDPGKDWLTSSERFNAYADNVIRLTKQIPGITAVSLADGLPLGSNRSWGVSAKGQTYTKGQGPIAYVRIASEGYIGAMGMHLVEGRDFTSQDAGKSAQVIIINQSMARALWPGESAIGKYMTSDHEREVVGVVGDVKHLALEQGAGLEMYLPLRQSGDFAAVDLVVRTSLPPASLGPAIRAALAPVAPNLAANEFQTLTQLVDKAVSPRRFFTVLLGAFATFALGLALLGIYGVISYTVNHRTQEIGVRIALGASAAQIQGRIIRETLELAAAGIALGSFGSWLLARTLGSFLFGVSPTDPVTFAVMLLTVTIVAVISGYLPARRASRIDPSVAFRSS